MSVYETLDEPIQGLICLNSYIGFLVIAIKEESFNCNSDQPVKVLSCCQSWIAYEFSNSIAVVHLIPGSKNDRAIAARTSMRR